MPLPNIADLEDSEHYHGEAKDCQLVSRMQFFSDIPSQKELATGETIEGKFCETHQISICKCGWEWNFHVWKSENPEQEIKSDCFLCGSGLGNRSIAKYLKEGNVCRHCSARVGKVTSSEKKRRITEKQADQDLEKRRKLFNFQPVVHSK